MQHRVEDYNERELALALASPHNSITRQDELEQEIIRRNYNMIREYAELMPLSA